MKKIKILTPQKRNYQLLLSEATAFLSDKQRQKLQGILVRAVDDAYERGKRDQEINR